jgi:hypothetical protein
MASLPGVKKAGEHWRWRVPPPKPPLTLTETLQMASLPGVKKAAV